MGRDTTHLSLRELGKDQAGTSAIEFAILCPFYLFLFMGMTAYGIYFGASHSVQQISADTARAAIAGIDAQDRRSIAMRYVENNADGYIFIDPAKLAVDVSDSSADGNQFLVVVRYDATGLPIWSLFGGASMPEKTILRRSTIRIGGI